MKILNAILGAILVLVTSSCSGNTSKYEEAQEYKLMTISSKDITLDKTYSASIKGEQDIRIIPRVDGYLTTILVKEGARVHAGQILFLLDQVSYKAELEAAKANVAVCEAGVSNAELEYNSKEALFKKNIVSDYDLKSAENGLKTAKAQLMQANAQKLVAMNNLSYTVIKSPSDGVIGKIPYKKGDYVGPTIQDGLTVVSNDSQMYIYFSMTEKQIMQLTNNYGSVQEAINKMPAVKLRLSNNTVYSQNGRIESISGVIDDKTGSVSVRSVFENKRGQLISGGAGSIIIPYNYTKAIVIPQEATYEIQDKTYVYKVLNGVTTSTLVVVDNISNGKEYVVTSGLEEGDVIIAEGAGLVQNGAKVSTNNKK